MVDHKRAHPCAAAAAPASRSTLPPAAAHIHTCSPSNHDRTDGMLERLNVCSTCCTHRQQPHRHRVRNPAYSFGTIGASDCTADSVALKKLPRSGCCARTDSLRHASGAAVFSSLADATTSSLCMHLLSQQLAASPNERVLQRPERRSASCNSRTCGRTASPCITLYPLTTCPACP